MTLVLFALEREAAPFRRAMPHARVALTGIGATAAAARTIERELAASRPDRVIMAGFCGGLRDEHTVGSVLIPTHVIDDAGNQWECDCGPQGSGRLLTTTSIIATPVTKRELGIRHRADIVDMESATVAAACRAAGVPFLAVRAVSDTVDTALSPELIRLLGGGEITTGRAIRALLRKPTLLGEFRRLAQDTKLAARNLAEALVTVVGEQGA